MTRWFTFYTVNTPYEKEASECVEAFKKYGIDVQTVPYESRKNWMKNCLWRAQALAAIAANTTDAIGLLDADVRPVADPVLLKDFSGDFAAHYRGPDERLNRRICAGVLIFGPTSNGRLILNTWSRLCAEDPTPKEQIREQIYLAQSAEWIYTNPHAVAVNLGEEYNRPAEKSAIPGTALVHWECSRFHAHVVGGSAL